VLAFRDRFVVKAILGGAHGRIVVAYYEWSDSYLQKLLIDWTLLDSEASIAAFANRLADSPISIARRTRSARHPLCIPLFGRSLYQAERRCRHSGDGLQQRWRSGTDMLTEA